MKHIKVKDLLNNTKTLQEVTAKGWVRTKRGSKNVNFIALNDGSTILLPAYLLSEGSDETSRQWLQLAIGDQYVDFN